MRGKFDAKSTLPTVVWRPDRFQDFAMVPLTLWQLKHQPWVWPQVWRQRFWSPPTKGSNLLPCVYNEGRQGLCDGRDLWLLCSYHPSGPGPVTVDTLQQHWEMMRDGRSRGTLWEVPVRVWHVLCCLKPILKNRCAAYSFGMLSQPALWLAPLWLEDLLQVS